MMDSRFWQGITLQMVVISILAMVLNVDLSKVGLSDSSMWASRLVFHFFHGNVLHLMLNAVALLTLSFKCEPKGSEWIASFIIASLYPLPGSSPVVGFSAIVYAMLGIRTLYAVNKRQILLINLSAIGFGLLLPTIAVGIHLWSYAIGLVYGLLTVPISKIRR